MGQGHCPRNDALETKSNLCPWGGLNWPPKAAATPTFSQVMVGGGSP